MPTNPESNMPNLKSLLFLYILTFVTVSVHAASEVKSGSKEAIAKFHGICQDKSQEPYTRAKACIAEVKISRATRLVLADMQIDKIPDEVFDLHFLTSLDINHTNVHNLPQKILRLKKLKSLSLTYNKFTYVPKVVFKLPVLDTLEMMGNQITIVEEIKNISKYRTFRNLRYLDLSANPVIKFPLILLDLKKVEVFFFSDTKLKELPENFGNLKRLRTLNLENNQLTSLPESFGNLKYLHALVLSNNKLATLPNSFGTLEGLSDLDLDHNRLKNLPENFGRLAALRQLDLSHNPFPKFPEPVTKLSGLTDLMYGPAAKPEFSSNMKNMTSLDNLHLYGEDYKTIPDFVFELPHLTGLVIGVKETLAHIPKDQIKRLNMKGVIVVPGTKLKFTDPNAWKI